MDQTDAKINYGTNYASTSDWLVASRAMNFLQFQPLLTQYEQSTKESTLVMRPPRDGGLELSPKNQPLGEPIASLQANRAASQIDYRPIWEVAKGIRDRVSRNEWGRVPADASKKLDAYLRDKTQ
jgi:hypothetical protein